MLDARKAKELAGIDPRTIKEQFEDDISHYIELEAKHGNRKMKYKIPEKFYHPDLITTMKVLLEQFGYEVSHDIKEDILEVRW